MKDTTSVYSIPSLSEEIAAEIIPTLRMIMMGENRGGILHFEGSERKAAEIVITPENLTPAREHSCVFLEGVGEFRYIYKSNGGRLDQKICVVTGSAQGFGRGIAEEMVKNGAYVIVADINFDLASRVSDELNREYSAHRTAAVKVDVGEEASVRALIASTVAIFGGLDVFVSNAGILKAGSLREMEISTFDLVTKINYRAYFLCVKFASQVMIAQHRAQPDYFMDIIQINSKSGLTGSNKNFAYAGGKFGGIGLTQSFALELADYHIKVNAICPGNFYDGPLWSDPENGLFKQYLEAGKVPNAKTVEDVKKYYIEKSPIHRGCGCIDVMRALLYVVEQEFETGQAIPVTGGQNMLH